MNDRLSNRHNGILGGLIGTESSDREREEDLKTLATTELKPKEEYIKVLDGEAFFTKDQQIQLLSNFSNLQNMPVLEPNIPYNVLETREMGTTITVTMGDVSLPNVQDVDGFARAVKTQFSPALRQAVHRR